MNFRHLVLPVYLPAGLFGIGMGAAAPVIVLTARELGAPTWLAALMVALVGLGLVLADLPAGSIVARWGERISIIAGSSIGALGVVLCLFAPSIGVLALGVVLTGVANAVWGLARQSYLAEVVPFAYRARAMASFALMMRLGMFLGPLIGAAVIHVSNVRGGFAVQLAATVLAGWLMARLPDPPRREPRARTPRVLGVAYTHRRLLATIGVGAVVMGAARASIPVAIPLWANHIGLSAAQASLIFAAGAAIDVTFSYPAGYLMDRFSRRFIAVPSLLVLGAGYVLLPFSDSVLGLMLAALVLGAGNGLGNGVIMTIGADMAPPDTRAEFLAVWRLMHDVGFFAGPLTVSGVAVLAPLAVAVASMSALSAVGAAIFARYLPTPPLTEDGPQFQNHSDLVSSHQEKP